MSRALWLLKYLKADSKLKHIQLSLCITIKHYETRDKVKVTKVMLRRVQKHFFEKKMLHPIFRTFLQKFPYIIEGIRVKLEAGICFVNLFIACMILNSTIQNPLDRVAYKKIECNINTPCFLGQIWRY